MSLLERVNRFLVSQGAIASEFDMPATFIDLFEILDEEGALRTAVLQVNEHFERIGDFEAQLQFQQEVRSYLSLRKMLFA